jgi:phosphomannomutase
MRRCFARAGFASVQLVDAQSRPDPSFPTVEAPNPENPAALALTFDEARRRGADLALVHDPDADRLGVLVPSAAGWRALTGNEIGLLLADHVLSNTRGRDRLVVDTVVSSRALAELAAFHHVHHVRTLTGFKWIVRPAIEHPEWQFVFGYEEALGYSVDPYVRDKDGISAALCFAQLAAALKTTGTTIEQRLRELATRHGLFATGSFSVTGQDEHASAAAMHGLRRSLPVMIGRHRVAEVEDLRSLGADLLVLSLEPAARLCIRPSGTEPKLKVYAEIVKRTDDDGYEDAQREAAAALEALQFAFRPSLEEMMND